jgi:hypothetical protein
MELRASLLLFRRLFFLSAVFLLAGVHPAFSIAPAQNGRLSRRFQRTQPTERLMRLPLSFEANRGQADPRFRYVARGPGYSLILRPQEADLALAAPISRPPRPSITPPPRQRISWLRMRLVGSNPLAASGWGEDPLPGKASYLVGSDPRRWKRDLPTYRKVRFPAVYPGVDLVYYGSRQRLEYDFIVAPGADSSLIRLSFQGAKRVRVERGGDLSLKLSAGEARLHKPLIYQDSATGRRKIPGGFYKVGRNQVAFRIGAYDKTRPLIIDPVLVYSTSLGGGQQDSPAAMAVDANGSVYLTGNTNSLDFPTKSPYQAAKGNTSTDFEGLDAFVVKLNPAGTALEYATYLGGSKTDQGLGIAVDGSGRAYVVGSTMSGDFPQVQALPGASSGSKEGFVTALAPTGDSAVYSTYVSGSVADVALDPDGNAYLTGVTSQYVLFPWSVSLPPRKVE